MNTDITKRKEKPILRRKMNPVQEFIDKVMEDYTGLSAPNLEDLLEKYIDLASSDTKGFVKKTTARKDFIGVKAKFHEYIELLEYLKIGFSEKDIASGLAHKSSYRKAHSEAVFKEYELCQKIAESRFGEELPKTAFLLADPVFEIQLIYFNEKEKQVESSTDFFTSAVKELYDNQKYKKEKTTIEQVKKAMLFFEKMGYNYHKPKLVKTRAKQYIQTLNSGEKNE